MDFRKEFEALKVHVNAGLFVVQTHREDVLPSNASAYDVEIARVLKRIDIPVITAAERVVDYIFIRWSKGTSLEQIKQEALRTISSC